MASRAVREPMFTPSGPHASSKPIRASRIDIGGPAPPNETPAQKVARLREAARRAKLANESQFDRVVAVGRVWADRAHKFTTYSLIGFTAVASVFVAVVVGDMLLYNRRKRNDFYDKAKALHAQRVVEARKAADAGTADAEQRAIIKLEELREAKESGQHKSIWQRTREGLFGGYSVQEEKGGKLGIAGVEITKHEDENSDDGVAKAVEDMIQGEKAAAAAAAARADGGIIDQLPPDTVSRSQGSWDEKEGKTSKSWWGWATGR